VSADDPRDAVRRHLEAGAPWDACDAFRDAIAAHAGDATLLHLGALAHARAGAPVEAHALIDRALALSPPPALVVELRSLRGRLGKDRLHRAHDGADLLRLARGARDEYLAAYAIAHTPYPGVNAATLSALAGERERAAALAEQVLADLARLPSPRSTWDLATEAEAELVAGRVERARAGYEAAAAAARGDAGALATMRRQLRLLTRAMPDAGELLACVPAPDVVAITGHRIDEPGRSRARFPASLVPAVDAAVRERVARWRTPIVFASAASGADLIALDAALDAGAEVNVVLPFDRDEFVRTSVAPAGAEWTARYERVIARASRVIAAVDGPYGGDDALFSHAARLVEGLAILRARALETRPAMLAVVDPDASGAEGGARESVERWTRSVGPPDAIDLRRVRGDASHAPDDTRSPPRATPGPDAALRRTLKTLLFADVVGYGKLGDQLVPRVQARLWAIVADVLARMRTPPRFANTWGDGLYVVVDAPADGAELALGLAEAMGDGAWTGCGIEGVGAMRVALHAGPVFSGIDPIVGRENFVGASVTRAARIEPITPPGAVYATEAFAATLAAEGGDAYDLEYVGKLGLAKGYGEARLYRVARP